MITCDTLGLAAFITVFGHEWITLTTGKQGTGVTFDMSEEQFREIKNAFQTEEGLQAFYHGLKQLEQAKIKSRQSGCPYDNPARLGLVS